MDIPGRRSLLLLLAIAALAAFFRFWALADVPPGLYPDEAMNGNNAIEALATGEFKFFYPENNGREGLFINLQAMAIRLFGPEPWALRTVSAFFGTLTILAVYWAAKELLKRNDAALLSAFFLATSFWHINFSRIGFRAILAPFLSAAAVYWLVKALRTGKVSGALAGGVATGLGFHTYIGFRFMPFVLAVPMVSSLRAWLRGKAKPCAPCVIALGIFAALIAALPLGLYFLQHPADFVGRSAQVSVFSAESPLLAFAKSNLLTIGMLNLRGDCNPRHNLGCQPELFWPVGILFVVGLLITIRSASRGWQKPEARSTKSEANLKYQAQNSKRVSNFGFRILNLFRTSDLEFRISRNAAWTLIVWFGVMTLPATLTREGLPHALRAIGMVPPVMIMAGIGGAALWQALASYVRRALSSPTSAAYWPQLRRIRRELAIAGILFLVWMPAAAWRDYFLRFAYAPETQGAFSNDLWELGRFLGKLPDERQKFVVVNLPGEDIRGLPAPAETVMFASDTFEEGRRRERNVAYVRRIEDIRIDSGGKVAIMPLTSEDQGLRDAIERRFPGFRARNYGGILVFQN